MWGDLQGDFIFRIPAIRLAEHQAARDNAVFSYLFAWPSPQFGGALGACHALAFVASIIVAGPAPFGSSVVVCGDEQVRGEFSFRLDRPPRTV